MLYISIWEHGWHIVKGAHLCSPHGLQVALQSWEHLLRSYLPGPEAFTLTRAELTCDKPNSAELQTDTDFISPVIKLICFLIGAEMGRGRKGDKSCPQRLDRCQLLAEVCLSLLATLSTVSAVWPHVK